MENNHKHNNNDDDDWDKCPVMKEEYSATSDDPRSPLVGVCGHSICQEALESMYMAALEDSKCARRKKLACPVCMTAGAFHVEKTITNWGIIGALKAVRRNIAVSAAATTATPGTPEKRPDPPEVLESVAVTCLSPHSDASKNEEENKAWSSEEEAVVVGQDDDDDEKITSVNIEEQVQNTNKVAPRTRRLSETSSREEEEEGSERGMTLVDQSPEEQPAFRKRPHQRELDGLRTYEHIFSTTEADAVSTGYNIVDPSDMSSIPHQETLRIWNEVAFMIDSNQIANLNWKSVKDSLENAHYFYPSSEDATRFVHAYLEKIISILFEQAPLKFAHFEKQEILQLAMFIVLKDLSLRPTADAGECEILNVLAMIFNQETMDTEGNIRLYRNIRANTTRLRQQNREVREMRLYLIYQFYSAKGISILAKYMSAQGRDKNFPSFDFLHHVLCAMHDLHIQLISNTRIKSLEDSMLSISKSVMDFLLGNANEHVLNELAISQPVAHDDRPRKVFCLLKDITDVLKDLRVIFETLASRRCKGIQAFYTFWRSLTLTWISSESNDLRSFGWDQVKELIYSHSRLRHRQKAFIVSGAGCPFINGRYELIPVTKGRHDHHGVYVRKFSCPEDGSKELRLYHSEKKGESQGQWFLSGEKIEYGNLLDIDYYQHKNTKQNEGAEPPSSGWVRCRKGIDPPPTIHGEGVVVRSLAEHPQLPKWARDNDVINLLRRDLPPKKRPYLVPWMKTLILITE